MVNGGVSRIENFPLSKLVEGAKVIVQYQPKEGTYAGRIFLIDYIVPERGAIHHCEQISFFKECSGKALYSTICEVFPNKIKNARDLEWDNKEFEEVFKEAIDQDRGTVLITHNGTLVSRIEDIMPERA